MPKKEPGTKLGRQWKRPRHRRYCPCCAKPAAPLHLQAKAPQESHKASLQAHSCCCAHLRFLFLRGICMRRYYTACLRRRLRSVPGYNSITLCSAGTPPLRCQSQQSEWSKMLLDSRNALGRHLAARGTGSGLGRLRLRSEFDSSKSANRPACGDFERLRSACLQSGETCYSVLRAASYIRQVWRYCVEISAD